MNRLLASALITVACVGYASSNDRTSTADLTTIPPSELITPMRARSHSYRPMSPESRSGHSLDEVESQSELWIALSRK